MRNTAADREGNRVRIRAAIEELLSLEDASVESCTVKALANAAGITRSALYNEHYAPLRNEFLERAAKKFTPSYPPQKSAHLAAKVSALQAKLRERESLEEEYKAFRALAISRLAAQHEILRQCRAELNRVRSELANRQSDTDRGSVRWIDRRFS